MFTAEIKSNKIAIVSPDELPIGELGIIRGHKTDLDNSFIGHIVLRSGAFQFISLTDSRHSWQWTKTPPFFEIEILPEGTEITITITETPEINHVSNN